MEPPPTLGQQSKEHHKIICTWGEALFHIISVQMTKSDRLNDVWHSKIYNNIR